MLDTPLKEGLISTLYNVSGIMFSIGLGLIVSFNLSGIRNREYIKEIRKNIANIRDIFISYFIISTLIYISSPLLKLLSNLLTNLKEFWFPQILLLQNQKLYLFRLHLYVLISRIVLHTAIY